MEESSLILIYIMKLVWRVRVKPLIIRSWVSMCLVRCKLRPSRI